MSIKFCAIDPSIACTALTILQHVEGDKFEVVDKVSLNTKGVKYPSRWAKKIAMYDMFRFWLNTRIEDISFFVIENYSYGSAGHLADLGELNGMFKYYIWKHDKAIDVIAPASVKKIITGDGRSKKDVVAKEVVKFISNTIINFNNTDESDSAAIGIAYAIQMMRIENEQEKDS